MKSLHCTLRLLAVVILLNLFLAPFIQSEAQAQFTPASFKDVVRGDGAKAWMVKKVVPKKNYVIAVSLPNMPDPSWWPVWYGAQQQAKKLGLKSLIADAGGYTKLDVQVSQIENFIQLKA